MYLGPTTDQLSHNRLSWFCQETGSKASATVQDPGWYWYPGQAGILPRAYDNVFTFNNAIITRVFIQVPTSCSLFYSLYFLLPDIIHLPQEGQLHKAGVFVLFPALSQCLLKQMNVCSLHCLVWSSQCPFRVTILSLYLSHKRGCRGSEIGSRLVNIIQPRGSKFKSWSRLRAFWP